MDVTCQTGQDQMEEVTLYPNKAKHVRMLVGSLLFTAGGVWMVRAGEPMGHLAYVFFGLTSVTAMIQMLPGASYLKLRDDEFEFGRLFRKHCVKWEVVERFGIWTVSNNSTVGWNYKERVEVSKFVKMNRRLGIDDCLADTYGMKEEKLLSLMNEYLLKHRNKQSGLR